MIQRLRIALDWAEYHALPRSTRIDDETKANLTLYPERGRRVRREPQKSPRAVSPAVGMTHEGESHEHDKHDR